MDAPQTALWGPALWRFLHSMAERTIVPTAGRNQIFIDGEIKRCWVNIMSIIGRTMPCPRCRQHFNSYKTGHPYMEILNNTTDRRERLRTWLWQFHTHVRAEKGQPTDVSKEALQEMYTHYLDSQYMSDKQIMTDHLRRGMFQRWLMRDDMIQFLRSMDELWRIGR
jgi:Erv1 / Alr family